jgi:hypothetical protein
MISSFCFSISSRIRRCSEKAAISCFFSSSAIVIHTSDNQSLSTIQKQYVRTYKVSRSLSTRAALRRIWRGPLAAASSGKELSVEVPSCSATIGISTRVGIWRGSVPTLKSSSGSGCTHITSAGPPIQQTRQLVINISTYGIYRFG